MEDEEYIDNEEALEKLLKVGDMNLSLIWLAATMATIAAINSLSGQTVMIKALVFMIISFASLTVYTRRYGKRKK